MSILRLLVSLLVLIGILAGCVAVSLLVVVLLIAVLLTCLIFRRLLKERMNCPTDKAAWAIVSSSTAAYDGQANWIFFFFVAAANASIPFNLHSEDTSARHYDAAFPNAWRADSSRSLSTA